MKKLFILAGICSLFLHSCSKDKNVPCYIQNQRLEKDPAILGMDISHFQKNINWSEIRNDGVNFVYIKASEGIHFKDPKFKQNRDSAKSNCIYRGAYHFYETGKDPLKQAENFIAVVEQLEQGDLPPVMDLEEGGIRTPVTTETYHKNTLLWLKTVEEKLGVTPIIYSDPSFGNKYLNDPAFAKYKLWVAEYTKAQFPKVPNTWKNHGWTIWQRTDREKLEGIGKVDYDLFEGDAEAFRKLLKK